MIRYPYGITNFSDETKIAIAETLINFSSLQDQANYAIQELGGVQQSLQEVWNGITTGSYFPGTRIWAASDAHVSAIYLTSPTKYEHYDPDSGLASPENTAQFLELMTVLGRNTFVVATPQD